MKYLILLLLSFNANAEDVIFTWTPPTERADNTPLSSAEIAGYKISCFNGAVLSVQKSVGNVTAATLTLEAGKNYCNMVTIDTDDRVSNKSNTKYVMVKLSKPNPPVMQ